ncbi:MAG: hypothetical protein WAQ53_19090 [Thiofilum sp.]|uniref:hypothetical protein n=1 Tax=Thiofilum sp. TaxID=2212733 RepID=UPI0025F1844E|nr:hypothetical protein [Thiofilum sp.]
MLAVLPDLHILIDKTNQQWEVMLKATLTKLRPWLVAAVCILPLMVQANPRASLGTNTNEISDDDTSVPFIDLFKSAMPFEDARPWTTTGEVQYDQYGWPARMGAGAHAGTRFLSHMPAQALVAGDYTVLYEGEGKLQYNGDVKLIESTAGMDVIRLDAGADGLYNASVRIMSTNPNNYIRNLKILMPGGICRNNPYQRVNDERQCARGQFMAFNQYPDEIIYNPDFLNFMKDFSAIRFMNMMGVTNNEQRRWQDRPRLEQATWGGKQGKRGVPVEIMVDLANRANANPWFTMPHGVDDNYVRQFATYVKQNLRPNLKAYVEYSNETWNTIFVQGNYVRAEGLKLKLDTNAHRAGYRFYAERSVQMFKIWEQVFGGKQRLVRVVSGWTVNPSVTEIILGHKNTFDQVDAFGIAPYFFGGFDEIRGIRNVEDAYRLMTDPQYRYSLPKVLGYISDQVKLAQKFGVELIAYEGGQGLVDFKSSTDTQHPNPILYAANRDPRMYNLYIQFLQGWKKAGGGLFAHYSAPRAYRKFGSWGAKEYSAQPAAQAPKYRALLNFMRDNPCWWAGCGR